MYIFLFFIIYLMLNNYIFIDFFSIMRDVCTMYNLLCVCIFIIIFYNIPRIYGKYTWKNRRKEKFHNL